MQNQDRVRHKKFGLGTVLVCDKGSYLKYDSARVKFDDGKETVCAKKRLQVLTAGQGATVEDLSVPEIAQPVPARRKGSGTAQIDYARIDRAVDFIRDQHPDADDVRGKVYGNRIYAEVWNEGSARIVFYEE